jgi:hypothetical protein
MRMMRIFVLVLGRRRSPSFSSLRFFVQSQSVVAMLSLVTSALALTVGMQVPMSSRAPGVSMMAVGGQVVDFGKLPASVSMAAATPVVVGKDSTKYSGGDTLSKPTVRKGAYSEFVDNRTPLSQAVGSQFTVDRAPTGTPLLKPMDYN